jgi:hypothetical protein
LLVGDLFTYVQDLPELLLPDGPIPDSSLLHLIYVDAQDSPAYYYHKHPPLKDKTIL